MDPLAISSLGPATLSALSALRPVQALAVPATQSGSTSGSPALSIQDLAQSLFQRTLQTAALFPVTEPATGSAGMALEATASLLAALNAPQSVANATPTLDATIINPTTNPAASQASGSTPATSPTATPPTTIPADVPVTQDAFASSLSPDFALQTALRFGAGVAAPAAPALAGPGLGAGLVRDAAAVPRLGNLQPKAGGPGPEAYAHPQTSIQRVLQNYQAVPAAQGSVGLDLLA